MEEGFIPDECKGGPVAATWASGKPERRGVLLGGVTGDGKQFLCIRSFRCTGCGYIELYAPAGQ
jgi:hypothetical protein